MTPASFSDAPSDGAPVDLLVVGGGVNGCGVARDAAGRGLSVVLCERGDLACGTSSASTKLIHGGLRYLEYHDFRLVREALHERAVLLRTAPHVIHPLRFVLPHHRGLRPAWMLKLGLVIYDNLAPRHLPPNRMLDLRKAEEGAPLKPDYRLGFSYFDAWADDARLVVLSALDAHERGARILTRTRLVGARRDGALWRVELERADGTRLRVSARALVNAAGPWVDAVSRLAGIEVSGRTVKLVKGSHIVLPRLYPGDHAYTLQGGDGRVLFAIPYQGRFTLVGTTDVPVDGDIPEPAEATGAEIAYLCHTLGDYFAHAPGPEAVVWSYAGVRPLHDDGKADASAVTRDYALDLDAPAGAAPALTIYGGKITTFRRLGEHALDLLRPALGFAAGRWTRTASLPGGDMAKGFDAFREAAARAYPWAPRTTLTRLCRAYGTRLAEVLDGARGWADMGRDFGAGLSAREVAYLKRVEWAQAPEDVLWRRSKLGLHMSPRERAGVAEAFEGL